MVRVKDKKINITNKQPFKNNNFNKHPFNCHCCPHLSSLISSSLCESLKACRLQCLGCWDLGEGWQWFHLATIWANWRRPSRTQSSAQCGLSADSTRIIPAHHWFLWQLWRHQREQVPAPAGRSTLPTSYYEHNLLIHTYMHTYIFIHIYIHMYK